MKQQRTFVVSLVMLVLGVVFTACVQVSPEEPIETDARQSEAGAEISTDEVLSPSEYFAANPELKIADRYANLAEKVGTGSAFYAANPELMTADRYTAPVIKPEQTFGSTFFAANPELMTAGRHTAPSIENTETSGSVFFATNPELMAAHRYAAAGTEK